MTGSALERNIDEPLTQVAEGMARGGGSPRKEAGQRQPRQRVGLDEGWDAGTILSEIDSAVGVFIESDGGGGGYRTGLDNGFVRGVHLCGAGLVAPPR